MRSSQPIPDNPWPHDMVLTIEDDSQTLLELLWIREAWRLWPEGDDLPPELVDTPPFIDGPKRAAAPITKWRDAWPRIWTACLQHSGTSPKPVVLERLHASAVGREERSRLLRELVGPSWRDEFGSDAMTVESEQWMHMLFQQRVDRARQPMDEQPEHAALDELIAAWRSGLKKIVQIPCRGTYTRVIGTHALLLTAETRADPGRYRIALTEFRTRRCRTSC